MMNAVRGLACLVLALGLGGCASLAESLKDAGAKEIAVKDFGNTAAFSPYFTLAEWREIQYCYSNIQGKCVGGITAMADGSYECPARGFWGWTRVRCGFALMADSSYQWVTPGGTRRGKVRIENGKLQGADSDGKKITLTPYECKDVRVLLITKGKETTDYYSRDPHEAGCRVDTLRVADTAVGIVLGVIRIFGGALGGGAGVPAFPR
jgi:hypothetical protein